MLSNNNSKQQQQQSQHNYQSQDQHVIPPSTTTPTNSPPINYPTYHGTITNTSSSIPQSQIILNKSTNNTNTSVASTSLAIGPPPPPVAAQYPSLSIEDSIQTFSSVGVTNKHVVPAIEYQGFSDIQTFSIEIEELDDDMILDDSEPEDEVSIEQDIPSLPSREQVRAISPSQLMEKVLEKVPVSNKELGQSRKPAFAVMIPIKNPIAAARPPNGASDVIRPYPKKPKAAPPMPVALPLSKEFVGSEDEGDEDQVGGSSRRAGPSKKRRIIPTSSNEDFDEQTIKSHPLLPQIPFHSDSEDDPLEAYNQRFPVPPLPPRTKSLTTQKSITTSTTSSAKSTNRRHTRSLSVESTVDSSKSGLEKGKSKSSTSTSSNNSKGKKSNILTQVIDDNAALSADDELSRVLVESVHEIYKKQDEEDGEFGKPKGKKVSKGKALPKSKPPPQLKEKKKSTKQLKAERLESEKRQAELQEEETAASRMVIASEGLEIPTVSKEVEAVLESDDESQSIVFIKKSTNKKTKPNVPDSDSEADSPKTTATTSNANVLPSSSTSSIAIISKKRSTETKSKSKGKGKAMESDSAESSDDRSSDSDSVQPKKKQKVAAQKSVDLAKDKKAKVVESRIELMMKAAGEVDESCGLGVQKGSGRANMSSKENDDSDEEEEGEEEEDTSSLSGNSKTSILKENKKPSDVAIVGGSNLGTPLQATNKIVSRVAPGGKATPGSAFKTPKPARGLAAILERTGLKGSHSQGLSNKAKLPRLHLNLKAAPPPKPKLPKEKVKPRKKGDEDYSDEEKPWYETKHPEDWNSDDREEWTKVQRRKEKGWGSD